MPEMSEIQEVLTRVWENLLERPSGPLALRFIVQPLVAAIFAVRDGLKDARHGRTPYFWTILSDPAQRAGRLREGFKAVGKIIVLAMVLDAIYQIVALRKFYPGEALIIAFVLAYVPYLLIRGPVARVARWWNLRGARSDRAQ
jgi:hypothetical protein